MRKWFVILVAALSVACKSIQYVPIETGTTISVKDNTVLHIKDSIRITEKSRYKDYKGLLDTLRIDGHRSHLTAWNDIDTTKGIGILNGLLEEEPVEEHTKIVYRDREVLKDTTIYKEIPIEVPPVEKVVKVVPRFWRVTGVLGIILTFVFGLFSYLKLKKNGFLSTVFKIFKK